MCVVGWACSGDWRTVGKLLIDAGLLDWISAQKGDAAPSQWICWRTDKQRDVGIVTSMWTLSTWQLPNKIQLLLDDGYIDACISGLQAYELNGVKMVGEASPTTMTCILSVLSTLDLTCEAAEPIVRRLRGAVLGHGARSPRFLHPQCVPPL